MQKYKLFNLVRSILLITTIVAVYIWLKTPSLTQYSLQAFAFSSLGYFLIKRFSKAKIWHILPKSNSYEIIFVTFSILILVSSTGNLKSAFYHFTYIQLFFLVMSEKEKTAIVATTAIMIFYYAMESTITTPSIITLITLPLMLIFFLFAKKQYDDVVLSHSIIKKEEEEIKNISYQEHTLESFITTLLKPKLEILEEMLVGHLNEKEEFADTNTKIKNQISLISSESEKILEKINSSKSN